jgi:hypothetical protein
LKKKDDDEDNWNDYEPKEDYDQFLERTGVEDTRQHREMFESDTYKDDDFS